MNDIDAKRLDEEHATGVSYLLVLVVLAAIASTFSLTADAYFKKNEAKADHHPVVKVKTAPLS
jgi:fructose-specific phosphotransferase system IIC component